MGKLLDLLDLFRKGAAVSAYYNPTDNFSLTLDYYGLRAEDNADLGGYLPVMS